MNLDVEKSKGNAGGCLVQINNGGQIHPNVKNVTQPMFNSRKIRQTLNVILTVTLVIKTVS